MSYYDEFPRTNFYQQDLGWLIQKYKELNHDYKILLQIYEIIKKDIKDITMNQLKEWLDDGTFEDILKNELNIERVFNTTIEMLQHSSLQVGQKIKTLGYYSVNDGGKCDFDIVDIKPNFPYLTLSNNLYAIPLLTDNKIEPSILGADATGSADSTNIIQEIINNGYMCSINYVYSVNGLQVENAILKGNGTLIINDTINLKNNTTLEGIVIKCNTVNPCIYITTYDGIDKNTTDITVRNIKVSGDEIYTFLKMSATSPAPLFLGIYGCVFENIYIDCNNVHLAIDISALDNGWITTNSFLNCWLGYTQTAIKLRGQDINVDASGRLNNLSFKNVTSQRASDISIPCIFLNGQCSTAYFSSSYTYDLNQQYDDYMFKIDNKTFITVIDGYYLPYGKNGNLNGIGKLMTNINLISTVIDSNDYDLNIPYKRLVSNPSYINMYDINHSTVGAVAPVYIMEPGKFSFVGFRFNLGNAFSSKGYEYYIGYSVSMDSVVLGFRDSQTVNKEITWKKLQFSPS